jgi:choline transport protein
MHMGVLGYSEGPAMSKLEEEESALDITESTGVDRRDMRRLGRKQEMRRSFRSLSMLSFSVIVQATWEFILWCVPFLPTFGRRARLIVCVARSHRA